MFSESFRLLIFLLFSLFVFLSELIFLIVNICSYYVVHLSSLKFGWKPVTLSPVYSLFSFWIVGICQSKLNINVTTMLEIFVVSVSVQLYKSMHLFYLI